MCKYKKSQGSTIFRRFLQRQQGDWAGKTSIWSLWKNCYSYNDALQPQTQIKVHSADGDTDFFNISLEIYGYI